MDEPSDEVRGPSNEAIEALAEQHSQIDPRASANRLSTLKHDLSHLFLPVDIDLQGWAESGFDEAYGKEIAEAYSGKEIDDLLCKARTILYSENSSVKSIVRGADLADTEAWGELKDLLPPGNQSLPLDGWNALQNLSNGDIGDAQDLLEKEQAFHAWFQGLENQLHKLRSNLTQSQEQEEASRA